MIHIVSAYRAVFQSNGNRHAIGNPFFDYDKATAAVEEFARVNNCNPKFCCVVPCYLLEVPLPQSKSLFFDLGNPIEIADDA